MSETTTPPQTAGQQPVPLVVNIQYVKDLSFEVPGAPQIFTRLRSQPSVNINLDVQARRVQEGQDVYEVMLMIRAEAQEVSPQSGNGQSGNSQGGNSQGGDGQGGGGQGANNQGGSQGSSAPGSTVFVAELTYAGVFTLSGLPESAVEPVLLVECPRLLFPFARNLLADVTREGGFPPVLLQPIDFVALWQARRAQAQAQPKGMMA